MKGKHRAKPARRRTRKLALSHPAPLNTMSFPFSTCSTAGTSSKMSSTRLPAARVFCRLLPRFARATTGPKELIMATVAVNTPSKPTAPRRYSQAEQNSMAAEGLESAPVTAAFAPAPAFIFSSSCDRASVCASIPASRRMPAPYWMLSRRPRRESSTKAFRAPKRARKASPAARPRRAAVNGTATPTTR